MSKTREKVVLKVRIPKFIISMLDRSGLLGLEKNITESEFQQIALYNYEHRTSEGRIKASGKSYVDWLGNVHFIQRDAKGRKISESIHLPDGRILNRR